ncbi:porin family protein [Alsobacter sp. SYSU M60028]|uniref:Porin family protein n=1 Tax=Alsobacter ponti TaxID=2962936 RepID=A0ABT1L737_9HYPH|nr:outer membrane protein [Alsobacter ponti]MCP8937259.1 porin family protein [Alsobacter ponti]
MRNALLAATALVAVSAPAFAADLPSRTMAPAAPVATTYLPVFTWTGFYVGLNAGYGWTNSNNITATDGNVVDIFSTGDNGGFTGGGQLGYNMQYGQIVFGLETDIQYADFGKNRTYATSFGPYAFATDHGNYFGTVRGRVGYAFDRALLYVTGGLAYGNVGEQLGGNDTNVGWTLGGGLEYAFTNNWTAKIEGLYVSLDRGTGTRTIYDTTPTAVGVARQSGNNEFGVVRVGLNYKF